MKKSFTLFAFIFALVIYQAQSQNFKWINEITATSASIPATFHMVHSSEPGIIYAAGNYNGSFNLNGVFYPPMADAGPNGVLITRMNADGDVEWVSRFNGNFGYANVYALTTDEDGYVYIIYIAQGVTLTYNDSISIPDPQSGSQGVNRVMKISPEGDFVATYSPDMSGFGTTNNHKRFYVHNEKIYFAGGQRLFGYHMPSQSNIFYHTLDDTGSPFYSSPNFDAIHFDGEKLMVGGHTYGGTISLGDTTITVTPTNQANVYGMFYAMLDTLGNVEVLRSYGTEVEGFRRSSVTDIHKLPDGHYYLATNYTHGFDLGDATFNTFGNTRPKAGLVKVNNEGHPVTAFSARAIGANMNMRDPRVDALDDNTLLLSANYFGGSVGLGDYVFGSLEGSAANFYATFTPDLELIFAQRFRVGQSSYSSDMKGDGHGRIYFNGQNFGAGQTAKFGCLESELSNASYLAAMENEPIPFPTADLSHTIASSTVYFGAEIQGADHYQWSFGDGTTSTQLNPAHTYQNFGEFRVCLALTNSCGTVNLCDTVRLAGIKDIFPVNHGNQGFMKADVRGAFFETGSVVRLVAEGLEDIHAEEVIFVNSAFIQPYFIFDGETPANYHLVVENPVAERTDTLFNAFELQTETGFQIWGEIMIPPFLRPLVDVNMSVLVGNNGNTSVYGVPVMVQWPMSFDVRATGNIIHQDGLPEEFYDNTTHVWQFFDTIAQKEVQIGYYLIPKLNPGEVVSIDFVIKQTLPESESYTLDVFLGPPIINQSDIIADLKTNCGGGTGCMACLIDLIGLIPAAGCVVGVLDIGCTVSNMITGNHENSVIDLVSSLGGALFSCTDITGLGRAMTLALAITNGISSAHGVVGAINSCAPGSCIPGSGDRGSAAVAFFNSIDPNIKFGPSGVGTTNYIKGTGTFPYIIMFENLEDATAAAYKVLITDTLDSNSLNLETFSFMSFGFADTTIMLGQSNLKEFVYEVDLRPTQNSIVRVTGELDMETGEVTVLFLSLDADTMEPETDPFAGFLPPNVNSPEGEGFVTFIISPQPELDHLDVVENYASIVFDENEPIITPLWINVIDREPPVSSVNELPEFIYSQSFEISWQGEDAHSGVRQIFIFMAEDNNEYALIHIDDGPGELTIEGEFGKTYNFYSIATDMLFNLETKPEEDYYDSRVTLVLPQYAVTYGISSGEGELEAFIDGEGFPSGTPADQGTDIVFVAAPGENYQIKTWTVNGETLENNTASEITVENLGADLSVLVEFEISTLAGIPLIEMVKVFPNPFNKTLTLQNTTGIQQVILMNITGQIMRVLDVNQEKNITLQTEGLQPGIYLLRLIAFDGSELTVKVSKL